MPFDFKLPDLGEGITEAEIRKWLIKVGDDLHEHQPVAEVETDKAIVEIPSPRAGRVIAIARPEGETAHVGETLLTIASLDEIGEQRPSVGIVGELPEAVEGREVLAMPAVRKLAREMGVDLKGIVGSGPRGSITSTDLMATIKTRDSATAQEYPGPVERIPFQGIRKAVARNVTLSRQHTVPVTCTEEADVTELWQLRERERGSLEAKGIHLTFLPFFIKAAQHALQQHPALNASIDADGEAIVLKRYHNFAIAVDTPDGLMVPVIRNVDGKSILELAEELQALGRRARERRISLEEMQGSSFTITNFGQFGGLFATPVINWPDVAILGFGRIADRPWAMGSDVKIRKIAPLSLTFDHRVTDGADAARFLTCVVSYLEDPALLFIESR